jgi:mannose-6-phosphate isomerase-like protein (cupin superfamily)
MQDLFEFKSVEKNYNDLAPDGSEIRLLCNVDVANMCHCTLPIGGISKAVKHKTIIEIWYCISGKGIIWQKNETYSLQKEFSVGDSFTIPKGNSFQFKNIGNEPLCILIATMPKWPGEQEAIKVEGIW